MAVASIRRKISGEGEAAGKGAGRLRMTKTRAAAAPAEPTVQSPPLVPEPREAQYAPCMESAPVVLGPMTGWTWQQNPLKLGMMLARYKHVARWLEGMNHVAEVGCGDSFGSAVVRATVGNLDLYDFDEGWAPAVEAAGGTLHIADVTKKPLFHRPAEGYGAIYMLDVLEHIHPKLERQTMGNICRSLRDYGVFVAGCPTLESQKYASPISLAGHVNCRTGKAFQGAMQQYFRVVIPFGMNDETLHTGFSQMCHYHIMLCVGPMR